LRSSINTFPLTFTETFVNGRPHRPGHPQRFCDSRFDCNRFMPTTDQVCFPRSFCRPQHHFRCNQFNPCNSWRAPYGGSAFDGCTRIHCNDFGCRVVDSFSYGGSCGCESPLVMGSTFCPGYPMPLGGGMTNLNNIQIDLDGRGSYNGNGSRNGSGYSTGNGNGYSNGNGNGYRTSNSR
jgi:hypothetical protein